MVNALPNNLKFEKFFQIYKPNMQFQQNLHSRLGMCFKSYKKKGEIIIPSWTWALTANAVLNTGNTPVFADVDLN